MSPKTIAVFCGRDYGPNKPYYEHLALTTGKLLAENGYITTTGGGPGMMSDVNKGAIEAGGKVISVQYVYSDGNQSPYFTEKHHFDDIRKRQEFLIGLGDGLFVLPGGIGTVYEALEVLALKRVRNLSLDYSLVFIGKEFYQPLHTFLKQLEREKFTWYKIDDACTFVDTPEEAIQYVNKILTPSLKKTEV